MVAGHLQEKNDFYYIVLSYKDAAGKRKTKWEATGLSVKRNKKKAEALLLERRRNFMQARHQTGRPESHRLAGFLQQAA